MEANNVLPLCSIGKLNYGECHKKTLCKIQGLLEMEKLQDDEKRLILLRIANAVIDPLENICHHHYAEFVTKYEYRQRFCRDPFDMHRKNVNVGLNVITMELADQLKTVTKKHLAPGQKICRNCVLKFEERQNQNTDSQTTFSSLSCTPQSTMSNDEASLVEIEMESLNTVLLDLDTSPIKLHSIGRQERVAYGKRKLSQATDELKAKVSKALKIESSDLSSSSSFDFEIELVSELKKKVAISPRQEKCKLLTLLPTSWTVKKISEEFHVTPYLARKSKKIKSREGILPDVEKRKGKMLELETINAVKLFYESDDVSRMCPGQKDFVSVRIDGEKVHKQKRLILSNLKEVFLHFKEENPEMKVGFSKFCSLRPAHCIQVTSNGMHNVCVCEIHQNLKLMLTAMPSKIDYKTMMLQVVCSTKNRSCMLHRCENCPSKENLVRFLTSLFEEKEIDEDDFMTYKQWAHKEGQTKLLDIRENVSDFISNLSNMMDKVVQHHFVAKAQAKYLRELKDLLRENEAIILLDFAENFSFVVQDAVQGFHWETSQCTIHPFVVYYKIQGITQPTSFCIVSDEMDHGAATVHCFIKFFISELKTTFPELQHVNYFSDGAASQYKNCKNLVNLCFHQLDFGLTAEWNFFATSHGKSPCDGIGGTAKRLVARAALQKTVENHILSPVHFYQWAAQHINGIKFIYVSKDAVKTHKDSLSERLSKASTVVGTRSHHKFSPISISELKMYRLSADEFSSKVRVYQQEVDDVDKNFQKLAFEDIAIGDYVAAIYDKEWYVALVQQAIKEELDFLLKFMKCDKMKSEVSWPSKEDECFVPINCILCILPAPVKCKQKSRTRGPEKYKIPKICLDNAEKLFEKMNMS